MLKEGRNLELDSAIRKKSFFVFFLFFQCKLPRRKEKYFTRFLKILDFEEIEHTFCNMDVLFFMIFLLNKAKKSRLLGLNTLEIY